MVIDFGTVRVRNMRHRPTAGLCLIFLSGQGRSLARIICLGGLKPEAYVSLSFSTFFSILFFPPHPSPFLLSSRIHFPRFLPLNPARSLGDAVSSPGEI